MSGLSPLWMVLELSSMHLMSFRSVYSRDGVGIVISALLSLRFVYSINGVSIAISAFDVRSGLRYGWHKNCQQCI